MRFIITEKSFYMEEGGTLSEELQAWQEEFKKDKEYAWYLLGLKGCPPDADISIRFLYRVAEGYFRCLTSLPELELSREKTEVLLDADTVSKLEAAVPFIIGAEYLDEKWIRTAFAGLHDIFRKEIALYSGTVAMYLAEQSQQLRVPERIFFHLVESGEEEFPFAFLATYATKNENGKINHMPLQYALVEYQAEREKLLKLLACLNKASEKSGFVREAVESGEMFHPLKLTAQEAYQFLKEIPVIEEAGILCRIPNWWKKRAMMVSMNMSLGDEQPSFLGFDAVLSMTPHLEVDGTPLTREDIELLLKQTEGLAFLKGKWIEVDHSRLEQLLKEMDEPGEGMTFLQALRGASSDMLPEDEGVIISNGKWLTELLQKLRKPETMRKVRVPASVHAQLRPYQKNGFTWLHYMNELGFGACLADDMGLGKTLQVLTFLEKFRKESEQKRVLLIVPASLLGNWKREAEKFVPDMPVHILHGGGAAALAEELKTTEAFLFITTYGMTVRVKEFAEQTWDCLILDEAQAIKNPTAKQTHAIKKIPSRMRLAMTGTPIENDLTNLWSIYDFIDKGLLGGFAEFKEYTKKLAREPEEYARLKSAISPFMLRRLKTDKRVITDLPEKVET
ncbi:MAG: DEAD/DEAH box helicase family protein, partial [Lachnospiraceae bacterium]